MIDVRALSKTFNPGTDGVVHALRNVNLTIPEGQWCNVLGPNGSGKSTLLKLLAGDLEPTSGDILVDGRSILREGPARRARVFFFVEQDTAANLVPSMTIEENLLLALSPSPFPGLGMARRKARRTRIADAVARLGMGLESRLDTQVRALSGGERQAVVLAKALIAASPALLLDEFLGAMDPRIGPILLRTARFLAETEHLTVLSVTHNLEQIMMNGEKDGRVVLLRQGEIVQDVSLAEIPSMEWLIQQYEGLVRPAEAVQH
jgi:putative ABC transport system ATP-binding protein